MKILVLGINGMLGHQVYRVFDSSEYEMAGVMRKPFSDVQRFGVFNKEKVFDNIDVSNYEEFEKLVKKFKPDAVINCISVLKPLSTDPINTIYINSLFPHKLAKTCTDIEARLLHISTDGVFSGLKGNHTEEDGPDTKDFYGLTKLLGEVG